MNREYIQVDAIWRKDGEVIPAKVYRGGRGHTVRVQRIVPLVTTKKGGSDYQYEVLVYGRPDMLYFERGDTYTVPQRWYRLEG